MDDHLSSKRYEPPIVDLNNRNSGHTFLIELTGYKKNVLEIGTSTGYLSKILKEHGNTVTGVEIDPEAGSLAQRYCERMIICDVETLNFEKTFEPALFDVILCGDILEHLKNPARILKQIKKFLKPKGYLVVSLPNFCHGDVFLNLLNGDFRYTSMGLLDETHLRFFGLKNVFTLFSGCGYQITDLHTTNLDIGNTELRMNHEKIPQDLLKFIRSLPNSDVYQFIFIASPSENITLPDFDEIDFKRLLSDSLVESRSAIQSPLLEDLAGKNQQLQKITENLTIVSKHAHNLETIIVDRDNQITEFSKHTHNLEAIIADRDNRITEFSKHTCNLEAIIADRDNQITEFSKLNHNLETNVINLDQQITELRYYVHNLETGVTDLDKQINELRQHARNLEMIVTDRDKQIADLRQHTHNLETIINDRDQQLQEFIRFNQSLSNENQSIKRSLTYNLTTKFHKKIVERILPQNTRIRKYYDLGLSGSRLLINEGWDRFWWCYNERTHQKAISTGYIIPLPHPKINLQESDNFPAIQVKVSVIIPTKNAGPEFESVLEKIKNQKGIASVEIIIVDSASTDGTCEIAEKYGCRIFVIQPEEFNHGLTRNYGAEQASGEFIVFLVQDAIPVGEYWLFNLVKSFGNNEKIAAVTCRQIPRSDADMFAGFILWSHYQSLNRTQNRVYSCNDRFDELAPLDKRIAAGVEDTCCMMQKKIFDRFKFRNIQYGEDLDIGIRLLKAGYKTAFVFSTGVIHSHNRAPLYFFKRSFVDTLVLDSLLNSFQKPIDNNISLKDLMEQILGLYSLIHQSMTTPGNLPFSGTLAINHLKKSLQSPAVGSEIQLFFSDNKQSERGDVTNKLEILLAECAGLVHTSSVKREDSLIASYCAVLDNFSEYCSVYSSLDGKELELFELFDKLFALIAGSTLATYYCKKAHDQLSESELTLMKLLGEGI
jgi:glycosyltransferase involved in cell wall biosynthesis/SAM-dependent methyltransferase